MCVCVCVCVCVRFFFERKKESKKQKEQNSPKKRTQIQNVPFFFVINKTRLYTHARIKHTHEIVLSARSTTGIVDDVDEICGS